jgi:predicted cation transporter
MNDYLTVAGLAAIMALTLVLPFSVKKVEEELEAFLFLMGLSAVTISGLWSTGLIAEAFREPVKITLAVLVLGFAFKAARPKLRGWLNRLTKTLGLRRTVFAIILLLGLGSSVITAIIAALALAEIISILKLERNCEIKIVVYACYAIGLGAALTPLGEPLATIAIAKLKAPPHSADFFYLIKQIGLWVAPGVILTAFMGSRCVNRSSEAAASGLTEDGPETNKSIALRAAKVYVFVMALIFLGAGMAPLAGRLVPGMPVWALYWANSVSAILDNATLAAAELVPIMTDKQVKFVLMGLLISGGMLIPGNIPNIISAAKLNIKSGEWAKAALPYGVLLMTAYFALMSFFVK